MNIKSKRSSNIELLRIVAMFMIVMYHIVCHCVNVQLTDPASMGRTAVAVFNQPVFFKRLLLLNSLMTFGIIGNAIFILISGYFMANRTIDISKMGEISKKLLLQLGFAAILLVCIPTIYHFIKPDKFINLLDINFFNNMSWFVGYYFMVVLCGFLFLNKFLSKLDYKKYLAFLLILFAFIEFSYSGGLVDSLAKGLRTVLTGIFLYSTGGVLHKFKPLDKVRTYVFILIPCLIYILIWLSGYNITETNIEIYLRSGSTKPFIQTIPTFENFSVVIIILALCLFEIFRRIRLLQNRIINFLGKSTFMIYLIHDDKLFYELWNHKNWAMLLAKSPAGFSINLLKWTIYTFAIGVVAYILYEGLMKVLKHSRKFIFKV